MRVGVVAGEASGDALGATLIEAIRRRYPEAVFEGIAGPMMQSMGATSLFPMERLSVRGYLEVLRALPELLAIRRKLLRHFLDNPPDLFVGIDAPDFNLALEEKLKQAGIPTLQMVAPTVWAWRAGRLPGIRRAVNGVLSIFPFEKPLFEQAGIPVTYVGHPLASGIPEMRDSVAARRLLGLPEDRRLVALLPGSRMSELSFHAALFVDTAIRLQQRFPDVGFVVPLIDDRTRAVFQHALDCANERLDIRLVAGQARSVLTAADVALVASGTATLEAALCKCPMVITYRLSGLTAWLVRRKGLTRFVGLPNIILGEAVVPELIQEQATGPLLEHALAGLLENLERRQLMQQAFSRLHHLLRADSLAAILQGVERVLGHDAT